jgi:hypothetical protein
LLEFYEKQNVLTLPNGNVKDFNLLKTAEIYFELICLNNKINLKQTNKFNIFIM